MISKASSITNARIKKKEGGGALDPMVHSTMQGTQFDP